MHFYGQKRRNILTISCVPVRCACVPERVERVFGDGYDLCRVVARRDVVKLGSEVVKVDCVASLGPHWRWLRGHGRRGRWAESVINAPECLLDRCAESGAERVVVGDCRAVPAGNTRRFSLLCAVLRNKLSE